jgi:hypothetical protein
MLLVLHVSSHVMQSMGSRAFEVWHSINSSIMQTIIKNPKIKTAKMIFRKNKSLRPTPQAHKMNRKRWSPANTSIINIFSHAFMAAAALPE